MLRETLRETPCNSVVKKILKYKTHYMKKAQFIIPLLSLAIIACNQVSSDQNKNQPLSQSIDSTDMTNNFYDNAETYDLPL